MTKIPVTLVIAVKDAASLLQVTLEKMSDFLDKFSKVIVMDSMSRDGVLEVCSQFKVCLVSEHDTGIYNAWNNALKQIDDGFVCFLGAGDYVTESWFKAIELRSLDADIFFFDVTVYSRDMRTRTILGENPSMRSFRWFKAMFGHPGSLHRVKMIKDLGYFDESFQIAADFDLILKCYLADAKIEKLSGTVMMLEGGVSSRNLMLSLKETRLCLIRQKLLSTYSSYMRMYTLFLVRKSWRYLRNTGRLILRACKHYFYSSLNFIEALIPFHVLRVVFFKALGFKLDVGASIGKGFKFYVLSNLMIGKFSIVNRSCIFDNRDKIIIGDNVNVARNVKIFTGYHDLDAPFFDFNKKPVLIHDYVVVLNSVIINPGTILRKGVVVLPGSVISGDTEEFMIYGGVPARPVRRRFENLQYQNNYKFPLAM